MKKVLISLFILAIAFLVFPTTKVSAKIIAEEKGSVIVAKDEVIDDDLFVGTQAVEIEGTVNGDVFVGAQTIKITGNINGNLHAGANVIELGGIIKGNVYLGAQNVLVNNSEIGGSLLVGAATVSIDKDSLIGGSLLAGSGRITLDSEVKRGVYVGTGNLTIGDNAKIGKDLYYASGNDEGQVNISDDALIAGTIHKSEADTAQGRAKVEAAKKKAPSVLNGIRMFTSIISFLSALVVGFFYFKFFAKHSTQTKNIITKSFWRSLGIGFLVTIVVAPVLIMLLITVVGIPIAGLMLLLLLLYLYLAKIVVGLAFGDWLSQKFSWKMSTYGTFVFGLAAIYLLKIVPVMGFLSGLVVVWVGLGALTLQTLSKSD